MGPGKPENMGDISQCLHLLSCPDPMPAPTAGLPCAGCAVQAPKTQGQTSE